jgi:hypothetical protein
MAHLWTIDNGAGETMPDFWNLSQDVYPNAPGVSTDVMLIQGMLIPFFLNPATTVEPADKARAVAIFRSSPTRFDDGMYGQRTREVLRLFEKAMRFPYADGIVRRATSSASVVYGADTKLKRLNFSWNSTMVGGAVGDTKKETGRLALNPILFNQMYGSSA